MLTFFWFGVSRSKDAGSYDLGELDQALFLYLDGQDNPSTMNQDHQRREHKLINSMVYTNHCWSNNSTSVFFFLVFRDSLWLVWGVHRENMIRDSTTHTQIKSSLCCTFFDQILLLTPPATKDSTYLSQKKKTQY